MEFSALEKIDDLLGKRVDELKEAKSSGKKIVGYFCCYIPEEIIHAHGMIPLRLSQFGDNNAASIGASYLTANACPFARSCVGIKHSGKNDYFELTDMIADAPACMQMRRVLEVFETYFNTKIILISIPRQFYSEKGQSFFANSLKVFSKKLESESGNAFDSICFNKAVELYRDIRNRQRRLYEYLKSTEPVISWAQVMKAIRAGFLLDRVKYLELLNELVSEVDSATPDKNACSNIRLLLAGGMLAPGDDKILRIIDEVNGNIVMDELCTGSRGIYVDVKAADIAHIARGYLSNIPCGSLPYPRLEGDPRHKHLKRIIKDYHINGVIYYTLRFCDAYSFKAAHTREIVSFYNIKFLHINSDHSTSDVHQIRTRIEAFIESIGNGIDEHIS